jgi:molybdopterin synthase catalytic subunit
VTTHARPAPDSPHPALDADHPLTPHGHDTSRLHPPAREVVLAAVTDEPLDVAAHEAAVDRGSAGAVVTFRGVVRDHDSGRPVTAIEYVAHPSAATLIAVLAAELAARTDCEAIAVTHRVGELAVGDAAIVVAVSAAHRQEAFEAASLIVDEVKHRLPIWKRQQFPDGTDEWVACP